MISKRELVSQAITFGSPERVPVWMFNKDHRQGDILAFDLTLHGEDGRSEWGYKFETLEDGTMGQPKDPVLPEWSDQEGYAGPLLDKERRSNRVRRALAGTECFYRMGELGLTGFATYTALRGFEPALMDFMIVPEQAGALLDRIFDFEMELIELAAELGLDGVHFSDDWGTQDGLIISPQLWRELFRPRYERQFALAHRLGLHVWFHCCGNIIDIIPDFHAIGVDVMNISQPNVVDLEAVGAQLRGRQCFMAPISYQTVSISGTPQEIHEEARRLARLLGTERGGLIGYVEEYGCMGMSPENYQACVNAFAAL